MSISSIMCGKGFKKIKQLKMSNLVRLKRLQFIFHHENGTSVSSIYTFSLAGNIIVCTPIQGTITEKYFIHIICKGKWPTHVENKHLSVLFFFHRPRLFRLSTDKCTGLIRQKWTSKWLFPRRHGK